MHVIVSYNQGLPPEMHDSFHYFMIFMPPYAAFHYSIFLNRRTHL